MPTNKQPIPLGLIYVKAYIDFIVENNYLSLMQPGDTTYINEDFENPPSVFIDGILLTYVPVADRRYVSFDLVTKVLTFNNAGVNEGENVQIFL